MAYVFALQSFCMFIIAGNSAVLGIEWIEIGYGLNPMIAFPLSALALVIAYLSGLKAIRLSETEELKG